MFVLILLAGSLVIIYFLAVRILMLYSQCTEEKAKEMIADWWRENASGQPQDAYELSGDCNYRDAVNSIVEDMLDEARYDMLCKLDEHSGTLEFVDQHTGFPTVHITVNPRDKTEAKRLRTRLESITAQYAMNYGDPASVKVLSRWSKNRVLCLPKLVIAYSRNGKEKAMLDRIEQAHLNKLARRCAVRRGNFRV